MTDADLSRRFAVATANHCEGFNPKGSKVRCIGEDAFVPARGKVILDDHSAAGVKRAARAGHDSGATSRWGWRLREIEGLRLIMGRTLTYDPNGGCRRMAGCYPWVQEASQAHNGRLGSERLS